MHNYNATQFIDITHWHVSAVVLVLMLCTKWHPSRVLISKKLNYFMISLRGKIEVQVLFENSMHSYNVILVHWHHTLGCQCSSFGTYAVHKVEPVKQPKRYWRLDVPTKWSKGPFFIVLLRGNFYRMNLYYPKKYPNSKGGNNYQFSYMGHTQCETNNKFGSWGGGIFLPSLVHLKNRCIPIPGVHARHVRFEIYIFVMIWL